MKKFKITITTELDLPDDFELAHVPREQMVYLKRGSCYFHPTIEWMYRKYYLDAGVISKFETPPSVGWESVDADTAEELFNASIQASDNYLTEVYRIEQL